MIQHLEEEKYYEQLVTIEFSLSMTNFLGMKPCNGTCLLKVDDDFQAF